MPLPNSNVASDSSSVVNLSNSSNNELLYNKDNKINGAAVFNQDDSTVFKKRVDVESNVLKLGGAVFLTGSGAEIGYKNLLDQVSGTVVTHLVSNSSDAIRPKISLPISSSELIPVSITETDQMSNSIAYDIIAQVSDDAQTTSFKIQEIRLKLFEATQTLRIKILSDTDVTLFSIPSEYSFIDKTGISLASGDQIISLNSEVYLKNGQALKVIIESDNACLLGDSVSGIPYNQLKIVRLTDSSIQTDKIRKRLKCSENNNDSLKSNYAYILDHDQNDTNFNLFLPASGHIDGDSITILYNLNLGDFATTGKFITISYPNVSGDNNKIFFMIDSNNTTLLVDALQYNLHRRMTFVWNSIDGYWETHFN